MYLYIRCKCHIHACLCLFVNTFTHLYARIHIYIYTHIVRIHVHMHVHVHICTGACACACVYIYIHIHNCCQVQSALTILPRSQASGRNQVLRFMHIPKLFGGNLGDVWVWGPEWGLSGNSRHGGSFPGFLLCVERKIVNIIEQFTCAVS